MRSAPIVIEPDAWCAWCGDPLPEPEERHHGRRYCSTRCKDDHYYDVVKERRRAERPKRNCLWCGAEFVALPSHKFTCTPKCGNALQNWIKARRRGHYWQRDPWAVTEGGADPDTLASRKRTT